jgi:hypothetical protein
MVVTDTTLDTITLDTITTTVDLFTIIHILEMHIQGMLITITQRTQLQPHTTLPIQVEQVELQMLGVRAMLEVQVILVVQVILAVQAH